MGPGGGGSPPPLTGGIPQSGGEAPPEIGVGTEIGPGGEVMNPTPDGEIKGNETAEVKRFKGSANDLKKNLEGGKKPPMGNR
jgi:hypothetical protein